MTERPSNGPFATAQIQFEWDPDKNDANIAKHGLGFENVSRVFSEPILKRLDDRRDYGEERWIALGKIDDLVVVVVYAMRSDKVRIISARKANRNEKKTYAEACRREVSGR